MKKLIYILVLLAITPLILIQCDSEDDLMTKDAKEGGLADVLTPSLNYVVGNDGSYSFSVKVYQGSVLTTKVYFYKSFYSVMDDTAKGNPWSNEILVETISITKEVTNFIESADYTYADLISGLTRDGNPLPTADGELSIGDAFYFRVVTEMSDGRKVDQDTKVKLTVATRFAGKYKPVDAEYYRIGVPTYTEADWAPEIMIESVDAITYKMIEYAGPLAFDGNTLYFQIDADGAITYPAKTPEGDDQVLNNQPIITCEGSPADMSLVHCGESNYIVKDDVNGKDRLYMSYGYYTAGSGPRTFYQVLEKIVE